MGRFISCLMVGGFLFSSGCGWIPATTAVDGIEATKFRTLLTGTNPGITLRPQPDVFKNGIREPKKGIQVTYFGSGGALIERGHAAILLAPFVSHHRYFRLGFWKAEPDTASINPVLRPYSDGLKRVRAVLLGHGHYDHLLDVSELVPEFSSAATVYGSNTIVNTLAPTRLSTQSLSAIAERSNTRGTWTATNGDSIRFMAISSDHAPNLLGRTIAKGRTESELVQLPKKAGGWKLGETFAYMIDFVDTAKCPDPTKACKDAIVFRIYYQDAGKSPADFHRLAFNLNAARAREIDLAILCVASFREARAVGNVEKNLYPETSKRVLAAKQYMLGHWENFWLDHTLSLDKLRAVPYSDPRDFVTRLERAQPPGAVWVMPLPGTTLSY